MKFFRANPKEHLDGTVLDRSFRIVAFKCLEQQKLILRPYWVNANDDFRCGSCPHKRARYYTCFNFDFDLEHIFVVLVHSGTVNIERVTQKEIEDFIFNQTLSEALLAAEEAT